MWLRGSPSLAGRSAVVVAFRVLDARGVELERGGRGGNVNADWTEVTFTRGGSPGAWPAGAAGLILDIAWTGSVTQDRVEGDIWLDDVYFGPVP